MSGVNPSINAPSPHTGSSSAPANGGTSSTPNFATDVVSKCEGIVEDYRKGKVQSKSGAIAAIYEVITHAGPATEEVVRAREFSFASFVAQIDEIDALRRQASDRAAAPDITHADSSAENSERNQAGQTLDRGRASSRSPAAPHGRKHSRDSSSSTERSSSKKKPFDEDILPFLTNRQSSIKVDELRPGVRETLRCKAIYARDVTASKQSLICQPDCPQIPDPVWSDILLGKYVDLDRIFSALHSIDGDNSETYKVGDLELSAGPSKPKKHIASAGEWVSAFGRYKQGVLYCYPHRVNEFTAYEDHIIRQFGAVGEASATRVINYDRALRSEISRGNQYMLTDYAEWNHLFTAYIVAAGTGPQGTSASAEGSKRSRTDKRSNDICQRYNQGRCTSRNCKYRHTCFCGSKDHVYADCDKVPPQKRK